MLSLFEEHVYGITPKDLTECQYTITSELSGLGNDDIYMQEIFIKLTKNGKSCGFYARMFFSDSLTNPAPIVIGINPFSHNKSVYYPGREHDHMPYELITAHGYIAVQADVDEACLDDPRAYQRGLMDIYPPNGESGWRAIDGWAFCTSRLIDYLVMREEVDSSRIAVYGCSRGGKTALWCAANRIIMTISGVSGCGGAAITRGKTGEHIKDITTNFPHWFCSKYASYANNEDSLPVHQHMLLALFAPIPLYVSSASLDEWADPEKEFESLILSKEIFDLYNKEGLHISTLPNVNLPVMHGNMGYHSRKGVHGCCVYDWQQYLRFMDIHFK